GPAGENSVSLLIRRGPMVTPVIPDRLEGSRSVRPDRRHSSLHSVRLRGAGASDRLPSERCRSIPLPRFKGPMTRKERGGEFERWIVDQYAATNGFTALILLLMLGGDKVDLLSCSYVHIIGDEVRWRDMKAMLDASGRKWDAFAIFPESPP